MRYRYDIVKGAKKIKTNLAIALTTLGLVLGGGGIALVQLGVAHAAPLTVDGCTFDVTGSVWSLQDNCDSTHRIEIPAGSTVEGNGYTISPTFTKVSNSIDNAALEIAGDNTTVNNLVIDGMNGTSLHGINVYVADNVALNDVTVKNNDHDGVVVNGSTVTVNNITTMNNGWGGIDVDQGGGVTTPAVLTVNGTSHQNDSPEIYVDNTDNYVSVADTNSQYYVSHDVLQPGDAVYTLKSQAKENCMQQGWMEFYGASESGFTAFKNQGQCVSWVEHNVLSHGHGH